MKTTINKGYKKPDYLDAADIQSINQNFDSIDTDIKNLEDTTAKVIVNSENKITNDITGNAATATKLKTSVNIFGLPFDGSKNLVEDDNHKLVTNAEKEKWNTEKIEFISNLSKEDLNNPVYLKSYETAIGNGGDKLIEGLDDSWYHIRFLKHIHPNGFGTQIAFPFGRNQIYMRSSSGTAWTQWVEINEGKLDKTGGTITGDLNVTGNYLAKGTTFDKLYFRRYGLNQINIDTTLGNWSCNLVGEGRGTVPYGAGSWFNVVQFEGDHFFSQIATLSSGNIGAYIRTRYVSNPTWGPWGRIVTEPIATPTSASIEAVLLDTQYRLALLENGVQDLK